jgi:anti-sigma regulatory factor (Ser/Thr protein kinase)
MQFKSPALISFPGGPVVRDGALSAFLGEEPAGEKDTDLMIAASKVDRVDVLAGVAARMRIARHLRRHPVGMVTITPPSDRAVAGRLVDLLSPLPDGVTLTTEDDPAERPRFALIPATQVADGESAHKAGEFALEACEALRVSEERANIIALAVMELAENALVHGDGGEYPPVVAATVSGRERLVEVAVLDAGRGISEAGAPGELLSAIPDHKKGGGFLPELLRMGSKHDLTVRIDILAGTGRLRWKWNGHRTESGLYVPGTTVLVAVNP